MARNAKSTRRWRAGVSFLVLALSASLAAQTPSHQQQAPAAAQNAATQSAASPSKVAPVPAAVLSPEDRHLADLLAEADHLVDLAQQLKGEIDKTNEYTLSLKAIKRAEEIQSSAKTLSQRLTQK
jgi:hypothetical protein